jgi:putative ABC transport system permease protein
VSVVAPPRPATRGGVPARRALVRWAWRLLRREWRSQALVTVLLMVTVLAAVCGGAVIYNMPEPVPPALGSAGSMMTLESKDPQAIAADVATIRRTVGAVDVIGHNHVKAPGSATPIDYRSERLHGTFTRWLLAIRQGRYPSGVGEAAITDGTAKLLGLRLGGTISLDGRSRTIVGIAENPADLNDEFVLVDPASIQAQSVSVLIRPSRGIGPRSLGLRTASPISEGAGTDNNAVVAYTLVLAAATVLLLLVAFVAAAAFAVLAHRRLRQLGMLAAIGATSRQVRTVMTVTGLLVGLVAAGLGVAGGLALWPIVAPRLESAAGHRIPLSNIPWPLIVALAVLAVAMSTGAAWWPSRAVARVPVTVALSGRPPVPRPGHRSALLALAFALAGAGLLAWGQKTHAWLVVGGTVCTALAIFFAGPLAIRVLAAAGSRAPVAVRLALRDLSRHQARSGAAVAAVSLALGIATALIVIATGAQSTPATGNLSDRQLLVQATSGPGGDAVPVRTQAELSALSAQVDRMAALLGHPAVVPLDRAIDPSLSPPGGRGQMTAIYCVDKGGRECVNITPYVATPQLLRFLRVDQARVGPGTDVVTSRKDNAVFPVLTQKERSQFRPAFLRFHGPAYTSLPTAAVTTAALAKLHLGQARAGWIIQSDARLTERQISQARQIAAAAGVSIETRTDESAFGDIRTGATIIGMLLALGILAMTAGLIRSEAAADLRTLTATGATQGIRRTLTATTAGALALLGAILGVGGGCLGLLAVYRHDLATFGRVPIAFPLAICLGTPLVAAVAGWLLAGREPPAIARRLAD